VYTFYQQVNLSPALGADSDVDAAVKKPMLHDMFDLLGLPVSHTGLSMFTSWLPQQEDSTSDSEDYGSMTKQIYSSSSSSIAGVLFLQLLLLNLKASLMAPAIGGCKRNHALRQRDQHKDFTVII
jgi:hypothetical protein